MKRLCSAIAEQWFHKNIATSAAQAVIRIIPAVLRDEKVRVSRRMSIWQTLKRYNPTLGAELEKFILREGSYNTEEELTRMNRLGEWKEFA